MIQDSGFESIFESQCGTSTCDFKFKGAPRRRRQPPAIERPAGGRAGARGGASRALSNKLYTHLSSALPSQRCDVERN